MKSEIRREKQLRLFAWWLAVALTVFISLPSNQTPIKLLITVPILLCLPANRRLDRKFLILGVGLTIFGAFLNVYDFLLNDKNWKMVNLYVTDIAFFTWLAVRLAGNVSFPDALVRSIRWSYASINICHLLLIVMSLNSIPIPQAVATSLAYNFGVSTEYGFWAFTSKLLVQQLFLLPCMLGLFFLDPSPWPFARKLMFALSVLLNFASLRLGLILTTVIATVILIWISRKRRTPNASAPILVGLGMVASIVVVVVGGSVLSGMYQLKFDDKLEGKDPRYQQAVVWLTYWQEAPLLGHGLSSVAIELADFDGTLTLQLNGKLHNEFGYELLPLKALAEMGLIGVVVYAGFIYIVFASLGTAIYRLRQNRGRPKAYMACESVRLAMGCYLFASCTNGYLISFGGLFGVFIPYALAWFYGNEAFSYPSRATEKRFPIALANKNATCN